MMNDKEKEKVLDTIMDSTKKEFPGINENSFSFAFEILKDQRDQSKRTVYIMFSTICILAAFIFWQDYNNTKNIIKQDESHSELILEKDKVIQELLKLFEDMEIETTTTTTTVEQDTNGEGSNSSIIGGRSIGETENNPNSNN